MTTHQTIHLSIVGESYTKVTIAAEQCSFQRRQLLATNYFPKKASSQMFNKVLKTPLLSAFNMSNFELFFNHKKCVRFYFKFAISLCRAVYSLTSNKDADLVSEWPGIVQGTKLPSNIAKHREFQSIVSSLKSFITSSFLQLPYWQNSRI